MVAARIFSLVLSTTVGLRLDSVVSNGNILSVSEGDSPTCSCGCCIVPVREDDMRKDEWLHEVSGHSVYGCGPIFNSQPFLHRKFANCEPMLNNKGNFCSRPGAGSAVDGQANSQVDVNHFCFDECMPSTVTPKGIGRECIPVTAHTLAVTPTLPPTTAPPAAAQPPTVLDAAGGPTTTLPPMPGMENAYVAVSGGSAEVGDCKTETGEPPCAYFGGDPGACETTCNENAECIGYMANSVDNCMLMFPCSRMNLLDLPAEFQLFEGPHSGEVMVEGDVCTGEEIPVCSCMRRLAAGEEHIVEPPACECVRVETNLETIPANCGVHGHTDEDQPWCYVPAGAVCDDPQPHEEDATSAPGFLRRYCDRSEEPAPITSMTGAMDVAGDVLAGAANDVSETVTEEDPAPAPPISNAEGTSAVIDSLAGSVPIGEVAGAVSDQAGTAVHVAGGQTTVIDSNVPTMPPAVD